MKYLLILVLFSTEVLAKEVCESTRTEITEDVAYIVNKDIPNHLKGAEICIFKKETGYNCVPAEKFMIVPRKQYTKLGQNKAVVNNNTCTLAGKKNNVIVEARRDVKRLKTETTGLTAKTYAEKEVIPGVNYYRRDLFDSSVGAGLGVDTSGVVKGLLGIEF